MSWSVTLRAWIGLGCPRNVCGESMTNGLIGKKLGMTQVFDESRLTPVTVIEAGPCRVVAVKTKERDQYEAVQLSFGEVKERKLSKPELGHLKKNQAPPSRSIA